MTWLFCSNIKVNADNSLSNGTKENLVNSCDSNSDNEDTIIKCNKLLFMFQRKDGKLKVVRSLVASGCSKSLCEESLAGLLKGLVLEKNKSTKWKKQAGVFKIKNVCKMNNVTIP